MQLKMAVEEFIYKYFVETQVVSGGYNIVNTLTYGIVLIAILVPLYKLLKKLKIELDEKFYLGMMPFLILGANVVQLK